MKHFNLYFFLVVLMCVKSYKSLANDFEAKNADGVTIYYNYINDGKEVEVTYRGDRYSSYKNEYKSSVVIPDEVTYNDRTYKVTGIHALAFCYCTALTTVTIPNSIKSIGSGAFSFCDGLNKVIVSDIAAWCNIIFADADATPLCKATHLYSDENTEIKDLVIPNSITSIGKWAFAFCSALTSVTIPNSVTIIGEGAFLRCSGLTSVTIPNSVTSIDRGTFSGCSGLTSVTIPNSVTSIGDNAFGGCSGLTSIIIPNSVTSIGSNAFYECSGLTSVTIPNGVTNIGGGAFLRCLFWPYFRHYPQ